MAQMIQLSYQPAFDPFHAAYRLLRLRETALRELALAEDHVRILDFYLLFPFRIEGMRVKQPHKKYRRLSQAYASERPYGDLPDDRTLFNRMRSIQTAALETLAKHRFIEPDKYALGCVEPTRDQLPAALLKRIADDNERQADLIEFLSALAQEYPLLGGDGLKDRTGLMEHLYDAA